MSNSRRTAAKDVAPPLPNNIEAERSVLGAILLDNAVLVAARELLVPEDFFHAAHMHIFGRMLELHGNSKPIDLVILTERMHSAGELEIAGGASYLAALADGMPKVSNVPHYAKIVKEKALLRAVIHTTHDIQQHVFEGHEDAGTILDGAESRIRRLREVACSTQKGQIRTYSPAELRALVSVPIEPIVYPLAVRGMLTLLDGHAKSSGKTTLGLHAVHASLGEKAFLGHATKKANVLYVTEEFKRTFLLALDRGGLSTKTAGLHILPRNEWSKIPWPLLAEQIEQFCVNLKIDWLVVDTFFTICGLHHAEQQNDAGLVDAAVAPLRSIAGSLDIAVQIDRHERKSGGSIGESGMGSVALTAAADIVLRLQRLPDCGPNVRELEITGRIDADVLTIELVDGQYTICSDDVRKSTQDHVAATDKAISANRTISVRQLSKLLHVGRFRAERVAHQAGWSLVDSNWERKQT